MVDEGSVYYVGYDHSHFARKKLSDRSKVALDVTYYNNV